MPCAVWTWKTFPLSAQSLHTSLFETKTISSILLALRVKTLPHLSFLYSIFTDLGRAHYSILDVSDIVYGEGTHFKIHISQAINSFA